MRCDEDDYPKKADKADKAEEDDCRAVGDIFNQAGLKPIKVTITAGNEEAQNGYARFTVPKQVLVSNLDAMMHTGELRIAKRAA